MNISIFGLGYVGCVSLGCLASIGNRVIGIDINQTKVDYVNMGKPTIIEKELNSLIYNQYKLGNISATVDAMQAVMISDVSFICVGTPSSVNGHLYLRSVYRVAEEIGKGIKDKSTFHIVIIRSTVLPGTNMKVTKIIEQFSGKIANQHFSVVSNPEFLREGSAVYDFFNPSYTIIGSNNEIAIEIVKQVYQSIDAPFIVTDIKIAEILKYVNNTFHALKVAFANEIGNICNRLGIDSHNLMDIFSKDYKLNISSYYLKPGFCYGGSCLPKDLKALKTIAHDAYLECPVIENIDKSNDIHKKYIFNKIIGFGKERLGFLGLSFKSNTDDLRNSPIIDIIEQLLGKGFAIKIYDRNVRLSKLFGANKDFILKKIPFISKFLINNPNEVIDDSDVVIIVNNDNEFIDLLKYLKEDKIIFDLVNINFENRNNLLNYFGNAW